MSPLSSRRKVRKNETIIPVIPASIYMELNDLFLIKLPEKDIDNNIKFCAQLELAHWFYLDNMCSNDPLLPYVELCPFAESFLHYVPLPYDKYQLRQIIKEYNQHKHRIPISGAIVISKDNLHVLLVQNFFSHSWGFPKGKIEENESLYSCASREVREETGVDVSEHIIEDSFIEVDYVKSKKITLFITHGISKDVKLKPTTKGEIQNVKWFNIDSLLSINTKKGPCKTSNHDNIQTYVFNAIRKYRAIQSLSNSNINNSIYEINESNNNTDSSINQSSVCEQEEVISTNINHHSIKLSDWNFSSPAFLNFKFL